MTEQSKTLIEEFITIVGAPEVEAHRSAFLVFARLAGWSDAKIGRYLGITRQRVSQKGKRIEEYAAEHKDMKTLKAVLPTKRQRQAVLKKRRLQTPVSSNGSTVRFTAKDWEKIDFARGMLDQVTS